MRSQLSSWTCLLTTLGFTREKRKTNAQTGYRRRLRFEQCEDRRMLATITVNHPGDFTDSDPNVTTLREAVVQANADPGQDHIEFASNLNGATIELALGELNITASVTIDASMLPNGITIDAGGESRIFDIFLEEGAVDLNSLRLTGGDAPFGGHGGAISFVFFADPAPNEGLTIRKSIITGNTSDRQGGGIYSTGSLRIFESDISGNEAVDSGGGISFASGYETVLEIESSIISGNQASNGGGIDASGSLISLDIRSSQITGNNALFGNGGGVNFLGTDGIVLSQDLNVESSNISNNFSYYSGGGLFGRVWNGSITINNESTIGNNTSDRRPSVQGPGTYSGGAYLFAKNSSVTIASTVVSNNNALGHEANVGGIAIKVENSPNVIIDDLKVLGNHADDDVGGLLIHNTASIVTVKNSTISGNTANSNASISSNAAGGVWLRTVAGGETTVESSTISSNSIVNR